MAQCNRKKPELLAPVGGWPQLKTAIRFGADAVYLACDKFGMRARAANFTLEDMPEVVRFAHENNVSVHVTMNTLMSQNDLSVLPKYFAALDEAGVDAFIISDLGAFALAQKYAPHVDIHVSTQASVMNSEAASMYAQLGAKRIVCAREMSLADIRELRKEAPADLEIEVFVHGAMCVAYSGRCLLSAAMTGRSGNKGACAQSCRWSYALVEELRPGEYFEIEEGESGSYVLNAKDLCMIEHIDELIDAGIDSFKIEGRNKQSLYVATVVGAYRSVIDGGSVEDAQRELHSISHRPYGTGFYFGEPEQSPKRDGYVKDCVHVATVEDCRQLENGLYEATALCQNCFTAEDTLEVLSPYRSSLCANIRDIRWLAPADGGLPFVERGPYLLEEVRPLAIETRVEKANRSKEHYVFICDVELREGDLIRKRFNETIA